jgi:aminoimidazole riboside kinase
LKILPGFYAIEQRMRGLNMNSKQKTIPVDVLGIGDALVDLSTYSNILPPRGGNIWSTAVRLTPGGTTANVASNLATLGIRSGFAGSVGEDPYGQYIIREFERAGVDIGGIVVKPDSYTGIVLAIIDDQGERTFICCGKGASHTVLLAEDLQCLDYSSIPVVQTSGVCLVEEPSRSTLLSALEHARRAECLVYFDPNLRLEGDIFPQALRQAQMKALSLSDVVLIGDEELQLLFEGKNRLEAINLLRQEGAKIIVVKQGEQGATLYSDMGVEHCQAFKVPVVSLAGAGDSFDAGFIAARQRGADLGDALVYASAVAGIKVTRHGSRSVPNHKEVLEFLEVNSHHIQLA